jgi:ligand-binding sensor domain-containing protein/signal transduction histidine kinase
MNAMRYFFFVFWQFTGYFAISQKQNVQFEHLGTGQGLSQSNVICILQDHQGFMWFGTRDGLNKYDGYKFTVYKNKVGDKNSISNNYIQAIRESKNRYLWIATWGGGLNRYDRQKDQFTVFKHDPKDRYSISSDFINTVLEDSQGNIWAGTEDGGLNMLDAEKNQFVHYTYNSNKDNSLGDIFVRNIFEDSQLNLWIATGTGGLNLFNRKNGSFTRFLHHAKDDKSIASNDIYTMFEDSKHRFWIGTNGGGLDLLNRENGEFYHFKHDANNPNSLANDYVHSINEDSKNNIWIGTENGGLSILDPSAQSFETYTNSEFDGTSLGNNSIYSIYKDTKDNLWIGTFSSGVDLLSHDRSRFIHYKHLPSKNSLSHNKVLCIYEDSEKNIWIGTDGGGVNMFDPVTGHFTIFRHEANNKNSLGGDYVLSIREDSNRNLWIGTWADGITVFNRAKNTFLHFKNDPADPSSLSNNNAWTIFEDNEKNIWVGTFGGGLDLFDPDNNSFKHFKYDANNKYGISSNKINSIYEDREGKLWISTDGEGLDLYDKKSEVFTHFIHDDKKNSISNNSVSNIFEDRNRNLWIGTMTGLDFRDNKTNLFTTYTTADGLPSNVISGILEDDKKNLWISTNKGISRFDPVTKQFNNYGRADGLQGDEFKLHAYCKSSSGAMYFGGNNGFNRFFPDSIKVNSFEPPLLITGFQIFNKEVPISKETAITPLKKTITETNEITVSYKSFVISFEFASLNYTIPEKKQYAYMLEGFDKTWNEVGTQRAATYTNLDPGTYLFKVKGLNNDGSWSSAVTSILLTITPPFWKTWWFKLVIAISIIGMVVVSHQYRLRKVRSQKKDLEKQLEVLDRAVAKGKFEIASDVMHDIGNAVVGFGSYLTRIKRLQDQDNPENLENLAGFFETHHPVMSTAIGEAKSNAVINMLLGIAQTQKSNREETHKSITEQMNIINHIQEILHIQRQHISGHETQERKLVNLKNAINDCISLLFPSIDKMGVVVNSHITAENPEIKGDRTKLMQVMLNILKNSIEAMDVHAAKKTIAVSVSALPGQLVIQVRDSGMGFDKAIAGQLFQRGFTTKFSGAGMGLYNSRAIIESHDGTIHVASDGVGKGALVTIGFKI